MFLTHKKLLSNIHHGLISVRVSIKPWSTEQLFYPGIQVLSSDYASSQQKLNQEVSDLTARSAISS